MARYLFIFLILIAAGTVHAVKIADITRLSGQRTNVLTGLGLVVGLRGTGDGGDFQPAIKPLAAMLSRFADPATVRELANASNVALVTISATVPPNGVRDGDRLDVYVTSVGAAGSLKGGRLFLTPMTGPVAGSGIYALADGPVVIEDPSTPTVGVVKGGAVMEADLPARYVEDGRFGLVLENAAASWITASAISQIINDAMGTGETLAVTVDAKNVVVTIPPAERRSPDIFISRIQQLPVPLLPTEARVQINERTGTMVITGDVEISPVVISHKGLTITTVNPPPTPRLGARVITETQIVPLDTTGQGGARLRDLVAALVQLKVPSEDRITIIKELHKTGKLHAKLLVE